jgi:hypothetical protein
MWLLCIQSSIVITLGKIIINVLGKNELERSNIYRANLNNLTSLLKLFILGG